MSVENRELKFLTVVSSLMSNDSDRDTIWNQLQGNVTAGDSAKQSATNPTRLTIFKDKKNAGKDIKNHYKDKIYQDSKVNPYLQLIKDFSEKNFNAVRLESADMAYLTNLGVYPVNRMWVLRRFSESSVVPDNLLDWGGEIPYPISTVMGWIPPDDDKFFGVSFNEEWTTTTKRVDEVLSEILDTEFNFKTKQVFSVPGWGQGLLMAFLNNMGVSNFNEIRSRNSNIWIKI